MRTFEDKNLTIFAENEIWAMDDDDSVLPGKDYIERLDIGANFCRYTLKYATDRGYCASQDLVKYLTELCEKANAGVLRQTLGNWLKGNLPTSDKNRENIYKLCFALGTNAVDTKIFFLKAFLVRPFDYKSIEEATYFFCMNNGLSFVDAERIIQEIKQTPVVENPDADDVTEVIGAQIAELHTEEEFVRYILGNRSGFEVHSQTARDTIAKLIDECTELAEQEYDRFILTRATEEDNNASKIESIDKLLSVIYGFSVREEIDDKPVFNKTIQKSDFPKYIRTNFPTAQGLQKIISGKEISYDAVRKALVILTFYKYFVSALLSGNEVDDPFDEFEEILDLKLNECGFVQSYWRNPFDWMFGYCASRSDPLGTFRELIEEFYLCDPEVQAQIQ